MAYGFSLMEVLVSLLIFTLIFLAMDGVQLITLQQNNILFIETVAREEANLMREKLKVYAKTLPKTELILWQKELQRLLPQGYGTVDFKQQITSINIFWGNYSHNFCKEKIGLNGCIKIIV